MPTTETVITATGEIVIENMIEFCTFDEAVAAARNEPGTELVGMKFVEPYSYLGVYMINVYPDEPDDVIVSYEGGALFDSMGEEDSYDVDDTPAEAKNLFYIRETFLGTGNAHLMGMTSEAILQEVLPGLNTDAKYRDQAHFMQVAGAQFRSFWRQR